MLAEFAKNAVLAETLVELAEYADVAEMLAELAKMADLAEILTELAKRRPTWPRCSPSLLLDSRHVLGLAKVHPDAKDGVWFLAGCTFRSRLLASDDSLLTASDVSTQGALQAGPRQERLEQVRLGPPARPDPLDPQGPLQAGPRQRRLEQARLGPPARPDSLFLWTRLLGFWLKRQRRRGERRQRYACLGPEPIGFGTRGGLAG